MKTKIYTLLISVMCALLMTTTVVNKATAGSIITVPDPLNINCSMSQAQVDNAINAWLQDYFVDGGCDVISVTTNYPGGPLNLCLNQSINVLWTAVTNNCGTQTAGSTIHIQGDAVPPSFGIQNPLFLNCTDNPNVIDNWLDGFTAFDNCTANMTVTNNYTGTPPDFCTGAAIPVVLTAVDGCGNSASALINITVLPDVIPPFLTVPQDLYLTCNQSAQQMTDAISFWLNDYSASDNCDANVLVVYSYSGALPNTCTGDNIPVTWTAYDDCNNSTSSTAYINVNPDFEPPFITFCPSDADLGCNPSVFPWGEVTAVDNCSVSVITSSLGPISVIGCSRSQTRTYTATDACGNTNICTQVFTWKEDPYAPVFTGDYATVNLGCNPSSSSINSALFPATAFDSCGAPIIQFSTAPVIADGCNRTQTRTYTATDNCGNSSTVTKTVTWKVDLTPPATADCTPGYDLGCNPVPPDCSNMTAPTFTDDCSTPTVTCSAGTITNTSTYGRSRTITWTATDDCYNTSTCSKTFTWKESPPINVDAGPNKIVYVGYPDSACAKLQSTISGGAPPLTRLWSTGSTASFITVCPTTTTVYYLTVTDANGCIETDSVKVCVIDIRCGNNLTNVLVCHGTGSATNPFITVCVDVAGAKWHLKKHAGEQLGPCGLNKTCTFPIETRLDAFNYNQIEEGMEFLGAFPNPFTGSTTVRFMLPENDFATVKVFDVTGREVEKLYEGETEAGIIYAATFDGNSFSKGMYFLVMQSSSGVMESRKLILDK